MQQHEIGCGIQLHGRIAELRCKVQDQAFVFPNWNASYYLQAQDRADRIPETRNVEVIRLASAGTIEEIIYARTQGAAQDCICLESDGVVERSI